MRLRPRRVQVFRENLVRYKDIVYRLTGWQINMNFSHVPEAAGACHSAGALLSLTRSGRLGVYISDPSTGISVDHDAV
jgi:hypothetical protein